MSDSQDAKNEARDRAIAQAMQPGADGLYGWGDLQFMTDYGIQVPVGARFQAPTTGAQMANMGFIGAQSPDPTMGLDQWLAQNGGMSLQDYNAKYGSLPLVWNNDGTVTYDPSVQRQSFSYEGTGDGLFHQIAPLLFGALAAGPLITGALGGAGASAAAAGGAMDMGVGLGGSLGSFGGITPLAAEGAAAGLGGAAAGAGVDFASSFAPTLSEMAGGAVTGGSLPAGSSIADMIANAATGGLGTTSVLTAADIAALGGALPAATGALGTTALDAFLNTTPINLGSSGSSLLQSAAGNPTSSLGNLFRSVATPTPTTGSGAMQSLAQTATGTGGLSQAELAALIESGTTGTAGATLETAGGLGTASLGDIAATGLANATGIGGSVVNGATSLLQGAGGTAGAGAAASTAGSALSRILSGNATLDDWLKIGGTVASTALGAYSADQQADAIKSEAARLDAIQAPWRGKLSELYANPAGFLESAPVKASIDQGTQAVARALSTQYGNPALAPNALAEIGKYANNSLYDKWGQEANRLAAFGGMNYPATASSSLNVQGADTDSGVLDSLQYAIGNLTAPKQQQFTIADMMRMINGGGNLWGTETVRV